MHYNTLRYRKRVAEMRRLLGGICSECESKKRLEIHHIDPAKKSFNLTVEFDRPWIELLEELKKCKLLCKKCHKKEHKAQHGSLGMYSHNKCRCDLCKKAWNTKNNEYKAAARRRKGIPKRVFRRLSIDSDAGDL